MNNISAQVTQDLRVNLDHGKVSKLSNIPQKTDHQYIFRTMQPQEVEETYHMVDKEGWNLSLDKFSRLYLMCPESFYVLVAENGEVAGTVSVFPTFEGEYVLGNIVIKETHRSYGLGRRLMNHVFDLHPGEVLSLTAVPGADQFYVNTGFIFTQPQQGHDIFHLLLDRQEIQERVSDIPESEQVIVSPYEEDTLEDLVAYDRQARGYNNQSYVVMQTKCFQVVTAKNPNGKLAGFGVAFVKRQEIVLDGLYADSDAVAAQIFREILKHFPDTDTMKLQVPSTQLFLSQLGQVHSTYKYNRYSRGGVPTLSPLSKIYNVGDCDYTY